MATSSEFLACKANIESTLGREMTPEEKRAIKNRAPEVMKKIANTDGSPGAVQRVLQTFQDEADGRKAFNQRANAIEYRAVAEFAERFFAANATIKHAGEAFRAITKGSLWSFKGSNDSLANLIDRERSHRIMAFDADLHSQGLLELAYGGELDEKIIGAEEQIRKGQTPDPKWGPQAIKIAQTYEKHTESARTDMNANGAWIPKNDDRLFAMRYDHNRIASGDGKFAWGSKEAMQHYVDEYMKRMDWDKAFNGNFVKATDAERRARVQDIWQQFKADSHFKQAPDFYGPGKTYGISPHIEMVLKTPRDSFEMWKQFGRGNSLAEAHSVELENLGRQLAVMKVLGVRAEKAIKQAFNVIHSKLQSTQGNFEEVGEAKRQAQLLEEAFNDEMQNTWRLITDTVAHPKDNVLGRVMSGVRLTMNTTATAMSLPTLITDLNLRAVRTAEQGRGSWLGNLVDAARMQFTPKGLTEAEQAQMFAQVGISLEINKRPTDMGVSEHKVYDGVRRANAFVRTFTGHSIWDNSARLSSMIRDFMHYHDLKGSTWDDMNAGERRTLTEFGIDRIGWDVMRKAPSVDVPAGWGKGIGPDQIMQIPLDEFKPLTSHQNPSVVTLKRMRDRLADQYRNLLGENANRNVSAPSTARLARLRVGRYYDPNTAHGWAMMQAFALKGWAINYMTEHLGRGILKQYDEHVSAGKIFKDLMTGQNLGGLKTTAQYMVGGVALAYLSNAMRSLAKGQAPVNPLGTEPGKSVIDQPWFDAWSEAMARGAAGIYGDFLFGQAGPTAEEGHPLLDKFAKLVTGPEAEFYLNVGDTLIKSTHDAIRHGIDSKAIQRDEQKAFGVGYHALPPSNLLATKWALDYFFYNALSEQINPGYQKRLKDYAKSQDTHYLAGQPGLK